MPSDPYAQYQTPPSSRAPPAGGGDDPLRQVPSAARHVVLPPVQAPRRSARRRAIRPIWALAGLDHLGMVLGPRIRSWPCLSNSSRMSRNRTRIGLPDYPLAPRRLMRVGPGKILGPSRRGDRWFRGSAAWRRKARLPAGRAAHIQKIRPISAALQGARSPVVRLAQARLCPYQGRQCRAAEGVRQARDGPSCGGDRLDGGRQRRRLCEAASGSR